MSLASRSLAPSACPPALLQLLRELPDMQLPPRGDLDVEAWLALCAQSLPRDRWVRLAAAVLS
jgi:hypothetical protein